MNLEERLMACVNLGHALKREPEEITIAIHQAALQNPWFEMITIRKAIANMVENYLAEIHLRNWIKGYTWKDLPAKKIGIIMAGNIPLVGFHDMLSVFMSGNISKIKLAQKDQVLLPVIIDLLVKADERTAGYFEIVEKLKDMDAVLATGSNNSARYFQYYFGKYPHLIRKNRVGVAVLNGHESDEELLALGEDVFMYFGLGCRNVSTLFVPSQYDFKRLLALWEKFTYVKDNNSYHNNYDYNLAIYIMGKQKYLANEAIFLVEKEILGSRIASLNYHYYDSLPQVISYIDTIHDNIQVIVSSQELAPLITIRPGRAQTPGLSDYADGVDSLKFMSTL